MIISCNFTYFLQVLRYILPIFLIFSVKHSIKIFNKSLIKTRSLSQKGLRNTKSLNPTYYMRRISSRVFLPFDKVIYYNIIEIRNNNYIFRAWKLSRIISWWNFNHYVDNHLIRSLSLSTVNRKRNEENNALIVFRICL